MGCQRALVVSSRHSLNRYCPKSKSLLGSFTYHTMHRRDTSLTGLAVIRPSNKLEFGTFRKQIRYFIFTQSSNIHVGKGMPDFSSMANDFGRLVCLLQIFDLVLSELGIHGRCRNECKCIQQRAFCAPRTDKFTKVLERGGSHNGSTDSCEGILIVRLPRIGRMLVPSLAMTQASASCAMLTPFFLLSSSTLLLFRHMPKARNAGHLLTMVVVASLL